MDFQQLQTIKQLHESISRTMAKMTDDFSKITDKKELRDAEKELKIVSKLCNELFHVNNYHRIKNNL